MQPEIEYGAWSPVDVLDYSSESKVNRVRSIPSSPPERQFVPKSQLKNRHDVVRNVNRRNFESTSPQGQNVEKRQDISSTLRPVYKRRTYSTTTAPATTIKIESSAGRFKSYRKATSDSVTAKPRRAFTPRVTSENILVASELPSTTKVPPFKKVPASRGNFRPKSSSKEAASKDEGDENYPEPFKQLLKNKEVNTQQNDKSVIRKPVKPFRPTSTSEKPSTSKQKSNVLFPTRQNRFLAKPAATSTTTTESPSSSSQSVTVAPKRPLRTRSRPTERTKVTFGSTLQEPPTVKQSTPIYVAKSAIEREAETYEDRIITKADDLKQIDPPISEYIPRTNSVSGRSRFLGGNFARRLMLGFGRQK